MSEPPETEITVNALNLSPVKDEIGINGVVTDRKTRKPGYSGGSWIVRVPKSWLDSLGGFLNTDAVEISRIYDPERGFCIVIEQAKGDS